MSDTHAHENRLIEETSPYLLQHAHNPVDWYPWGPEALARAKELDKPILLSIGYAACHWCHVMERESFENEATAAVMNEHYVCIKVDREERPDIDAIYMAATVAMSGGGGWPMTVFLTPDEQQPFFAGTYFPPTDRYGRPGFVTLLKRVAELWKRDRNALMTQAAELTAQMARQAQPVLSSAIGEAAIDAAQAQLKSAFDPSYGGFGNAPKFPPSMSLQLLLRHHRRTGDKMSWIMVKRTLDAMAAGGMRDHIGGGFARYSTDERWLVPHFEKMLYDNALLARIYANAYQLQRRDNDRRVACETLDYILREMTSEQGAFYSATDADSEGVEGKFFVWTPDEVEAVLPPEQARAFCGFYDITPQGNWEGHSIAHTPRSQQEVAEELSMTVEQLDALLAPALEKLYQARLERVPPLLDDKVLVGWNALMIGTMAECGLIFDEVRYRDAAVKAADFIWQHMRRPDGGLFRTTRAGKTHLDAYLEDYAYLCDALIDVYEANGTTRHLERAAELAERLLSDFHDKETGAFFATAHGHEKLVVRLREGQDGPIPAANAVAAQALTRLSWHLGRDDYRERALGALMAHGRMMERAPRAFAASLIAADMLLEPPAEVVLAQPAEGDGGALLAALGKHYLPNRMIVRLTPGQLTRAPAELTQGKQPIEGAAALYICRNFACERPLTDASEVATLLGADQERALQGRGQRLGKRIAGAASAEGTARYAARFTEALGEHAFMTLGETGWRAGRIAFGGYRVDDGTAEHERALEKALLGGCNLVDTSTNYTDGGSERLIGAVVGRALAAGKLARDEVVLVSKIGYVQGGNLELAQRRLQQGEPFAEMVKYQRGCWHCIHPDFLADQLQRSLDRLGVETLDVCLLHNPEYFFSDAVNKGGVHEEVRAAFYERIERAFGFFEEQVKAGRIGCYGVSSNSVAQDPKEDPEATELSRFWAAAERAGGAEHHFRVLQLPVNLIEAGGVLDARNGEQTVLAYAAEKGLAVLANRPLNAITKQGMLRLATVPLPEEPARSYEAELAQLAELEARFAAEIGASLSLPAEGPPADKLFLWAQAMVGLDQKINTIDQFEQVSRGQIIPQVSAAISIVERSLSGTARASWTTWRGAYIRGMESALAALRDTASRRAHRRAERVREAIDPLLPLARQAESLQRKALWTLASAPGLSVVLLGMRRTPYVDDALEVMRWAPMPQPERVLAALRA